VAEAEAPLELKADEVDFEKIGLEDAFRYREWGNAQPGRPAWACRPCLPPSLCLSS